MQQTLQPHGRMQQTLHLPNIAQLRADELDPMLDTNAFTSAGDLFTSARAANAIRITDLANVPIEFDARIAKIRVTIACMRIAFATIGTACTSALRPPEHLEGAHQSKQAVRRWKAD